MTHYTDHLSFALSNCLSSIHRIMLHTMKKRYRNKQYVPDYDFVFQSLEPIYSDPSKLASFVSPIKQRLRLDTQQGKDNFIQVHGPSQANITKVTDWHSQSAWTLGKGEYQPVVGRLLRCLGLDTRNDALEWAWMLKLDLYCPERATGPEVVHRGLRFLWFLCGGKEAFGALVHRIVYEPLGPDLDDAVRQIVKLGRETGPADKIMEFAHGYREGPMLPVPTYQVFTYPLRLPDRNSGDLPVECHWASERWVYGLRTGDLPVDRGVRERERGDTAAERKIKRTRSSY